MDDRPLHETTNGERYRGNRGGHAPAYLREAFHDYLSFSLKGQAPRVMVVKGKRVSARHVVGRLWTCTDILPPKRCLQLDIPVGSSYARAAQKLMPIPNVCIDCEREISVRATRCRSCNATAQWSDPELTLPPLPGVGVSADHSVVVYRGGHSTFVLPAQAGEGGQVAGGWHPYLSPQGSSLASTTLARNDVDTDAQAVPRRRGGPSPIGVTGRFAARREVVSRQRRERGGAKCRTPAAVTRYSAAPRRSVVRQRAARQRLV